MQSPRHLHSLIISLICLVPLITRAETEVFGWVSGVWEVDGSPYIATDRIMVGDDDELVIGAGVEVRFDTPEPFFIYGLLAASGDEDDSILFAPIAGAETWGGLRFLEAESESILSYCIIRMGVAEGGGNEADSSALGGNLFLWRSDITLESCRISNGYARLGGGGLAMMMSEPTVTGCLFNENRAEGGGGGLHLSASSSPILTDCITNNNSASAGGGMMITRESSPTLTNSLFSHNEARASGGALNINLGSSPQLSHCSIIENHSPAGAGIYIRDEGSAPLLEWCYFYANTTNEGDRVGGGIYIRAQAAAEVRYCQFVENDANYGGAIYAKEPPRCFIHHNLFLRNGALRGGGGVATSTDLGETPLLLTNCTFLNNRGTGLEPYATAAYAREGSSIVINSSIVWGIGPLFAEAGRVNVIYSNVKGGYPGDGNSFENPRFFERDPSLFLLRGDSPCVDSGDPTRPADPDNSQCDRGWLYFPHNFRDGLESDTLTAELTTIDRLPQTLRFVNRTGVPIYASPLDRWQTAASLEPVDVSILTGDYSLHSAAWTADGFALAGGNNAENPNKIWMVSRALQVEDSFNQPGQSEEGFLDLATDGWGGSVIYGGDGAYVYELTTDGEEGDPYDSPPAIAIPRGLGVDFHFAHRFTDFYIGGYEGYIIRADDEMWERDRIQVGDTILGLGVKGNTRALYIATEPDSEATIISLVNPDEDRVEALYRLNRPDSCHIGGFEVTQGWESGRGSLVGIWEGAAADYLFVDDLYTAWLVILPDPRLLMPGEEAEWDITFAGDQMPAGDYLGNFRLAVNGYGEGGEVYAAINLRQSSVPSPEEPMPIRLDLVGVYPNPFNAQTRVVFRVAEPGVFTLALIDATGRLATQVRGRYFTSGMHALQVDAAGLPSGSYLMRLDGGSRNSATLPVVILK